MQPDDLRRLSDALQRGHATIEERRFLQQSIKGIDSFKLLSKSARALVLELEHRGGSK